MITVTSYGARETTGRDSTRAGQLLARHQVRIYAHTDRLFAVLFAFQWLAGIAAALWLSPRTWAGPFSETHLHVWAAVYLGGTISILPIALALFRPGRTSTRYVIAVAQMLSSALLIHLTGGRIETHFHVFGSLAFLSFYRDWRVLIPATIVVAADHFIRGVYWPQSVFGVLTASQWRWLEHAGWVLFENIFLTVACVRSQWEMQEIAERSAALEASEERYRSVMAQAAEGICLLVPDTKKIIECNATFRQLLGDTTTESLQASVDGFDWGALPIHMAVQEGGSAVLHAPSQCTHIRGDGSVMSLSVTVSRITYGSREVLCVVVRDITERRRAQDALRQSEQRYALAVLGANDGIWDWDLRAGKIYLSRRWKEMLGLGEDADNLVTEWFARIHADDRRAFHAALHGHLDGGSPYFQHEYRMLHAAGSYRWMFCRGVAVRDDAGEPSRMAGSQTDVTERHLAEEQLRHAALHDALTGLANRALFSELLARAVARSRRQSTYRFAVLFVDLDRFKVINDSLGHLAGDQLLRAVADRLQECLRPGDVIGRFGGDEFTILLDELTWPDDATQIATRVQEHLQKPFRCGDHEICVTASIGVARGGPEYDREEELLRDADIAMYHAKAQGKNRHEVFDAAMFRGAVERLTLENDLRRALEDGEFVAHYQPIMSLSSQAVVGFEALLRWQRADGRHVQPGDFIPVAEETGLIIPIGTWMLREACRQSSVWQQEFPSSPPLVMAVNVSTRQLKHPRFVNELASILRDFAVAPNSLHLEITESALMDNTDATMETLRQVKALSVQLVLDDFGTGYSCLSYLHRFPLDTIKIDRSFVDTMQARLGENSVVDAIITLAKKLGTGIVAEGVETSGQMEQLIASRCEHAQGYFFCPPVAAAAIETVLRRGRVWNGTNPTTNEELTAPTPLACSSQ